MDTFLPPIEEPHGLSLKLAYYFSRRQFGKVPTPIKVHSAPLPPAFGLFYAKVSRTATYESRSDLIFRDHRIMNRRKSFSSAHPIYEEL